MATIGEVRELPAEFVYEWKIKDFFSLKFKVDEFYKSPLFQCGGASWYLRIYTLGQRAALFDSCSFGPTRNTTGHVGLCLWRNSSCSPMKIQFTLGLKTVEEKIYSKRKCTHVFTKVGGWGFSEFLHRSNLLNRRSELMPAGDLTVLCKMKYIKPAEIKKVVETCALGYSTSPQDNKILEDYKQMFLKPENCDVVINVKGQEFPAHKNILAARSPVLSSMFLVDMKEKKTNTVDIEDVDPSTFPDFLGFLYYGDRRTISPRNVFSLFTVADKYIVPDRREKCITFMRKNLSLNNFCETMTIALLHTETELIDLATNFFVANAEYIVETVKWQSFITENPIQGNELFIKYMALHKCIKP